VGGRGRSGVPASMVANYVDRYPSQLPGGALEGTLPPGPDDTARKKPGKGDKADYDSTNPQPDIEHYDPRKVKLPDSAEPDPAPGNSGAADDAASDAAKASAAAKSTKTDDAARLRKKKQPKPSPSTSPSPK
jgi:hypothetical protein